MPAPCEPAVGLELRLARAARADAAAEPLEVLPHAAHARQVVLELRELDLELALGARRRAGRRCRGSAAFGRSRARRACSRGSAAAPARARRRRAGSRRRTRRSAASAPRACPCRRTCAAPGGRGAGRSRRPARLPPSARAPPPRPARRPHPHPGRAPRGRTRARAPGNVESSVSIMALAEPHPATRQHPVRVGPGAGGCTATSALPFRRSTRSTTASR